MSSNICIVQNVIFFGPVLSSVIPISSFKREFQPFTVCTVWIIGDDEDPTTNNMSVEMFEGESKALISDFTKK
jgi:hypothetical protein